jgi:hypothetical protein
MKVASISPYQCKSYDMSVNRYKLEVTDSKIFLVRSPTVKMLFYVDIQICSQFSSIIGPIGSLTQ